MLGFIKVHLDKCRRQQYRNDCHLGIDFVMCCISYDLLAPGTFHGIFGFCKRLDRVSDPEVLAPEAIDSIAKMTGNDEPS